MKRFVLCFLIALSGICTAKELAQASVDEQISFLKTEWEKLQTLAARYSVNNISSIDDRTVEILRKSEGLPSKMGYYPDAHKKAVIEFYNREIGLVSRRVERAARKLVADRFIARLDLASIGKKELQLLAQFAPQVPPVEPVTAEFLAAPIKTLMLQNSWSVNFTEDQVAFIVTARATATYFNSLFKVGGDEVKPFAKQYREILANLVAATNGALDEHMLSLAGWQFDAGDGCCKKGCTGCGFSIDLIKEGMRCSKILYDGGPVLARSRDNKAPPEDELAQIRQELKPLLGDLSDPIPKEQAENGSSSFRRPPPRPWWWP